MNTSKNLQVYKVQGDSWPVEQLSTFKEQFTSACFYHTQIIMAAVCCMLSDQCEDSSHTVQTILQTTELLNIGLSRSLFCWLSKSPVYEHDQICHYFQLTFSHAVGDYFLNIVASVARIISGSFVFSGYCDCEVAVPV